MHDSQQRHRQKNRQRRPDCLCLPPEASSALEGCVAGREKWWEADKTEQKTDWKQLLWVESFFSPVSLCPKQHRGGKNPEMFNEPDYSVQTTSSSLNANVSKLNAKTFLR